MSTYFCLILIVLNIGLLHGAPLKRRFCISIMRMDCTKGFAPNVICGDDGINYPNNCAFSKAMCQNKGLNELHTGPCVVPTTEAPTTEAPTTEAPTTTPEPTTPEPTTVETTTESGSVEDRLCKTILERNCDTFKEELICGTDGRTYKNDCLFSKAMCRDLDLDEQNPGPCIITTEEPTTIEPTTEEPTTIELTTEEPTTIELTTEEPTTIELTTEEPTTIELTTEEPTTIELTTEEPTTIELTTEEPTTVELTTEEPTTIELTTEEPTTIEPTTEEPTTIEPTTEEPNTIEPTTEEPTTIEPTTEEPNTIEPTTEVVTTIKLITEVSTTIELITENPTTIEPTTKEPTTIEPTTELMTPETTPGITSPATETTKPNEGRCCRVIMKVPCTGFQDEFICGSDGVTYQNECEFMKASCREKTLKELPREACGVTTTEEATTPQFATPNLPRSSTEASSRLTTTGHRLTTIDFRPIVKDFFCSWTWEEDLQCDTSFKDYTCASDHRTYRTRCDMAKAHCDYPDIHVVQEGICPGDMFAFEYKHHNHITHLIMP